MKYLGIDVVAAYSFGLALRQSAAIVDAAEATVSTAEALAELSTGCAPLLFEVVGDLRSTAAAVERAATDVSSLVLPLPWWRPSLQTSAQRTAPSIEPARWDANQFADWNLVHQDASHNSYKVEGGIEALFVNGVRTFEIDTHRGAPTNFNARLDEIIIDHLQHDGGVPDDWQVYHFSGDARSEYATLGEALVTLNALPTSDPLTVFVDNKDPFAGSHTPSAFDDVVLGALGPRLFGPQDLLARAPGAGTLQQALAIAGWPTVDELGDRVMVFLTDEVSDYPLDTGQVFVATTPRFESDADGRPVHQTDPNVVVYNVADSDISPAEIVAIQAAGNLVRTYENGDCPSPHQSGPDGLTNYLAIDIDGDDPPCPEPFPQPPRGTPVPHNPS